MDTLKTLKKDQERIWQNSAAILSAIASPVRLQLIHFLSQAPQSVDTLASKIGQSVANTSMHLRKMQSEKILRAEARGQRRIYSLSHPSLYRFWEELQDFIQAQDPSLELNTKNLGDGLDWDADWTETRKALSLGKAMLLDIRPEEEVAESRLSQLKYYLHVPSSELEGQIKKLSKSKDLLVFCRGRMCALGAHTVKELRDRGYRAYRLKQSWYGLQQNLLGEAL